jgi:hypothetical protein
MKLLPLLLISAAAASLENYHTVHTDRSLAKSSTVTKTFKFKDDFFLRFSTLSTGISPEYGEELLDKLNNEYGEEFRDKWVTALMGDLPDECSVEVRSIVFYSVCLTLTSYMLYIIFYTITLGNVHPNLLHLQMEISRLLQCGGIACGWSELCCRGYLCEYSLYSC